MNRTAARLISRLSVNFAVRGQHYRCSAGLYRSLSAFTTSSRNDTAKPVILVNTCSSSNVSTNREPAMNEDLDASKLTTVQKFKLMWKKYGILTVITYFGLYGCTLTAMFLALEADVLSASSFGLDSTTVISSFCDTIENWTGNTTLPKYLRENPVYGTAVLAYIMTKFTEPARIGITVVAMPRIARLVGKQV